MRRICKAGKNNIKDYFGWRVPGGDVSLMVKRFAITILGLFFLIGLPAAIKMRQFSIMGSTPTNTPPETVTTEAVHSEFWPHTVKAVGSLVAVQGVTLGAELSGKVVKINFESGDRVKAGDVLVQFDTAMEKAQLRSAEAAVELARLNLARTQDLLSTRMTSRSEFDTAEAQFKQAVAEADDIRAVIEKKTLRAPFAGRLGLRLINVGQILDAGDPIVTLQTLDPIYADFSVPQKRLSTLTLGAIVRVTTDAAPGRIFQGRINAVNPEIDPVTRAVRVQATVSNVDEKLRSGMFADVEVVLHDRQEILAIPATAILYAPYGDTVFVIEKKKNEQSGQVQKVLRQQIVRLGRTRGDYVAVNSGLKAGEAVVSSGVFKLRPHMTVVVDNTLAPDAQLAPHPENK